MILQTGRDKVLQVIWLHPSALDIRYEHPGPGQGLLDLRTRSSPLLSSIHFLFSLPNLGFFCRCSSQSLFIPRPSAFCLERHSSSTCCCILRSSACCLRNPLRLAFTWVSRSPKFRAISSSLWICNLTDAMCWSSWLRMACSVCRSLRWRSSVNPGLSNSSHVRPSCQVT